MADPLSLLQASLDAGATSEGDRLDAVLLSSLDQAATTAARDAILVRMETLTEDPRCPRALSGMDLDEAAIERLIDFADEFDHSMTRVEIGKLLATNGEVEDGVAVLIETLRFSDTEAAGVESAAALVGLDDEDIDDGLRDAAASSKFPAVRAAAADALSSRDR
jgi:hypothetical protein